ncbi:MAG: phosphoglycerate dehydrogenase [Nitrososphaeria archaeon]
MPKILITSKSYGVHCMDALRTIEKFAQIDRKPVSSREETISAVKNYDGIILGNEKLDREVILAAERLKIIARHGVGVDNIDVEAATEKGIVVTYTPLANSDSVAEYAVMLVLASLRQFQKVTKEMLNGNWIRFLGHELMDKTVGIVGFGAIGRRVAKKLSGFSVRLIVYDPYVEEEEIRKCGVEPVSLETLLSSSDVVTLHLSLTNETKNLINDSRIKLMKKSAFLINTSRGGIIDEPALVNALRSGCIAGAALDVFEQEPLSKDSPIHKLDNVILSPHMANFTIEALSRMDMMNAKDLELFFKGQRPIHMVNPRIFRLK